MKLGSHVQVWSNEALDFTLRLGGPVLKVMSPDVGPVADVLARHPKTQVVVRKYFDDSEQRNLLNAVYNGGVACAKRVLAEFEGIHQLVGNRLIVESLNEIGLWDDAPRYNDFTMGFADKCRLEMVRPAVYSFACGNPPGYRDGSPDDLARYWAHYLGGLRACRDAGGVLSLHEYDAPSMRRLEGWLCLRYRKVIDALPDDLKSIPILLTEVGIDGGVIGAGSAAAAGWKNYAGATEYLADLQWYDSELAKDPQVIGATIFTVGGDGMWTSFDLKDQPQIADALASTQPATPAPEEVMPKQTKITLTSAPKSVQSGASVTFTGKATGIDGGAMLTARIALPQKASGYAYGVDTSTLGIRVEANGTFTFDITAPAVSEELQAELVLNTTELDPSTTSFDAFEARFPLTVAMAGGAAQPTDDGRAELDELWALAGGFRANNDTTNAEYIEGRVVRLKAVLKLS